MLKWLDVLREEMTRLLGAPQESEMSNRWNQLADEFVARGRLELLTMLNRMDASDRRELLGAAEDAEPSPGLLAVHLASIVGGSGASREDLDAVRHPSSEDIDALRSLLHDQARMHFVKVLLLGAGCAPRELTFDLTRAAIYTVNPSFNKQFILRSAREDPDGVRRALSWFLENGNAWEVAGAYDAIYCRGSCFQEAGAEELDQHRRTLLRRFVEENDLDLRRSLVSHIAWDPSCYSCDVSTLLNAGRQIASKHEDEYIRKRFAYDTGKSTLIPPLPQRAPDPPVPTDVT